MDDRNISDNSWKKLVIAKANNEWISSMKMEQSNLSNSENPSSFSIDEQQEPIALTNIKKEIEDSPTNYDICMEDPISIEQEVDLLVPVKNRRRRGSAPKNESPDERAARLAKMSAYSAQRLANESPEQRASRLKRMSAYAARRLAQETTEQRNNRLARMSAYAAKRLASETIEQRRARLDRMSAYAARRLAVKKQQMTSDTTNTSFSVTIEITPQES